MGPCKGARLEMFVRVVAPKTEVIKVVYPEGITSKLFVNRGATGATGPQGPIGNTGATGATGASYTPGDPIYALVRNTTGATLPKGTIVYTSGANGNHVEVTPALASGDSTSARTLGWLSTDLANNADGYAMVEGYLEGLNTQGLTAGSQLYLSGTTAGGFTASKPSAPTHLVYVGVVAKVSAADGHVYVKVQNGYELDEIHDVLITSKTNGDLLQYESSTGLWKNKAQSTLTVAESQVTNLVTDLAARALLTTNTFTGVQTLPTASGSVVIGQTANNTAMMSMTGYSDSADGSLAALRIINKNYSSTTPQVALGGATGILVSPKGAGFIGAVIRGAVSQSADLLQIQNSAGTVLAKFDSGGSALAAAYQTQNAYLVAGEIASGGSLRLSKSTAASAPAANYARFQVLAGTNANTLKLVVVGPAGTAYTIVDNIA